jgi:hypothetical protein
MMFINSGTYELATPAWDGLDSMWGDNYQCTYEFEYICDGIIIHNGPNLYWQAGSFAIGRHCMLALLARPVSVVMGALIGIW